MTSVFPRLAAARLRLSLTAALLALSVAPAVQAQVVVIDPFTQGIFTDTGASEGILLRNPLIGSAPSILGGHRYRFILSEEGYSLGVSGDGLLRLHADGGLTELALGWGRRAATGASALVFQADDDAPLALNLTAAANLAFQLQVPEYTRTLPTAVALLVQSGPGAESLATFAITGPGTYTIPVSSFGAGADFSSINGVLLNFVGAGAGNMHLGTLSVVPEPEEWMMVGALGLVGWAICRRRNRA